MSVAIVGGGLAGFTAHATLVHGGLEPGDMAVFDASADPDPAAVWRRRAAAIRQLRMRSESDGHCGPTSFPGLAVREARRRRSVAPLVQSACDRYRPSVASFLEHVEELRGRTGWDESLRAGRVERIRAVDGGFELDGRTCPGDCPSDGSATDMAQGQTLGHGPFSHVLVCTGHPGLHVPDELAGDPRVVHAYEPHEYAGHVAVIGAGMAAATEWLNALAAGARVTSVRRREPVRRPLNVPRPLFSRRGLAAFHATGAGERVDILCELSTPSYPAGAGWDEPLRSPRFRVGELNGAEQVVCATGFRKGFRHDPLLARLVDEHALETHDRWLALAPDCTVPALTDETRTLALAGVAAQWAYPAADTLVGAKYAARRFLRKVQACPTR
jgi:cation diffusion facilitator CzcD-associated flavoprotein CzcO